MPTLYITREDGTLGLKGQALCWRPGRGGKNETLPADQINDVIIMGQGNVTTQALHMLMDNDIPVHYVTSNGRYQGSLTTGRGRGYQIRRLQYEQAMQASTCLTIAQHIIVGKLLNQRKTLLRYLYRRFNGDVILTEACLDLKHFIHQIFNCKKVDEVRGIEGIAARVYFRGFSRILRPPWFFVERNRRPPKDPVNALLSFGYTLLLGSVVSALIIAGLDPCVGFIHPEFRGRPSLALDLMEEFRSSIIDRMILSICNQELLCPNDFQFFQNEGVIMKNAAKTKLLRLYSNRLRIELKNESTGQHTSVENHIRIQAAAFVKSLKTSDSYLPFIMHE